MVTAFDFPFLERGNGSQLALLIAFVVNKRTLKESLGLA